MRIDQLTVQQIKARIHSPAAEVSEGYFGAMIATAEHGFATENRTHSDTIHTANQVIVTPNFN